MNYVVFKNVSAFNSWNTAMATKLGVATYTTPILHPSDDRVVGSVKDIDVSTPVMLRSELWVILNGFFDNDEVMSELDKSRAYSIYKYINFESWEDTYVLPSALNFSVGLDTKLRGKLSFLRGELQEKVFYEKSELNPATGELEGFEIPVVREGITWQRDSIGFCYNRHKEFSWFFLDGTEDIVNTVATDKPYDNAMSIAEGKRRRGNIMNALQKPMMGMMLGTIPMEAEEDAASFTNRVLLIGRQFLMDHREAFTAFVDESDHGLLQHLLDCNDDWITNVIDAQGTTIRDYLLNSFDIWA